MNDADSEIYDAQLANRIVGTDRFYMPPGWNGSITHDLTADDVSVLRDYVYRGLRHARERERSRFAGSMPVLVGEAPRPRFPWWLVPYWAGCWAVGVFVGSAAAKWLL